MFDFRLKVFYTIAQRGSFSKAAEELHITQPAVTKHVKMLEERFGQKLFERKGYRVELTPAGEVLNTHAIAIFEQYQRLEFDMNTLLGAKRGQLEIAASTTIAQYWLPPILALFHQKFPEVQVHLTNVNTERVERLVVDKEKQLGLIEGSTRKPGLQYEAFLKDEIVLVVGPTNPLATQGTITLDDLSKLPLLVREPGSGTRQVLTQTLKAAGKQLDLLNIEMQLGGSESIKSYLSHSNCAAFLSIQTVLKELQNGDLTIVDVQNFNVMRQFYFVQPLGDHSPLTKLFKEFILLNYNLK